MVMKLSKSSICILVFVSALSLSGCSNSSDSVCSSIRGISQALESSLGILSENFSASENEKLAQSLSQLRELSAKNNSIGQPKALLEKSIEDLMSNIIARDPNSAAENVNDMTVAIQSINAACENLNE
jgi:hypothetical protein